MKGIYEFLGEPKMLFFEPVRDLETRQKVILFGMFPGRVGGLTESLHFECSSKPPTSRRCSFGTSNFQRKTNSTYIDAESFQESIARV